MTTEEPTRPLLSIVRGTPTPEELAAVVAVIASRGGGEEPTAAPPPNLWSSKAAAMRTPIHPGPGAWTASQR